MLVYKLKISSQSNHPFILQKQLNYTYAFRKLYKYIDVNDKLSDMTYFKNMSYLDIIEVSESVYSKLAYRDNIDGIIAIVKTKENKLSEITLSNNPLVIVLEKVEKPGNLGAILRTADAAKVDAVRKCKSFSGAPSGT